MAGMQKFNFVADNVASEKETTPIALSAGELVVVRLKERTGHAGVWLKIVNNGETTFEEILGMESFPTNGLLTGTQVSVVVRFNSGVDSSASGIIEVGV